MLKQRIITALILLPIALCGFFLLEGTGFALFIGLVVTLGAWEWARLAGFTAQPIRIAYAAVVAFFLFIMHILPGLAPWVLGASVLWWGVATYLVLTYPRSSEHWASAACKLVIGLLILLPAWQGLVQIKQEPLGNWLIMAVMVLVWGADIGAYFSGRAFGKRKLAPKVSPGKSWEGVYGGLLLSLVLAAIVGVARDWSFVQILMGLLGSAVIVFISVVGDLTESMFKRQSGIKDSSNLLPGHGGVLDRIDSLTAAIPVFAVLLWMAAP
ncbi:phosphatidate cytidylyltransferase [Pseudomonas sp. fls2-241-R2A-110]|jgi:phosphatidate cytidylyltransferase|uniref:phosphatidate cytidylyltransferase n=1 Tax=Pseudomonas sp. fls2-241-R2A-110 TaxID=3040311 RepID=UPI002556A028|nr:phosphatidate cytidylyltransferase [Pseudomonas sp. fls2-241-R2A-110]